MPNFQLTSNQPNTSSVENSTSNQGIHTFSSQNKRKRPSGLRRGKWTAEESAYASRLVEEFKAGVLPLTDGTTLRAFLAKLLNCDPMRYTTTRNSCTLSCVLFGRISKKFVGPSCIGKVTWITALVVHIEIIWTFFQQAFRRSQAAIDALVSQKLPIVEVYDVWYADVWRTWTKTNRNFGPGKKVIWGVPYCRSNDFSRHRYLARIGRAGNCLWF